MAATHRILPEISRSLIVATLMVMASCKPAAPPAANQTLPAFDDRGGGHTSRQPSAKDFDAFFQTLLPSVVQLTDLKTDSPTRMPDTSPDSDVWMIKVKIVITPVEDLLALPTPEETRTIDGLTGEFNALIAWRNAYIHSPYARAYGSFELAAPPPVPQLLIVQQTKGKPLAPLYGKVAAEWEVDHWHFSNIDLELPSLGQPRSSFTGGSTMIKDSRESEAFLAVERKAVADGKERQAVIEANYTKNLSMATKLGTIYRGQINYARGVLPCEVRFLETPGADPQVATFEVRVPQEPSYQYVYTATLAPKVPLKIVSDAASSQTFRVGQGVTNMELPGGNCTVNFVRGAGKMSTGGNLAGVMLSGAHGLGSDKPLLLLEGHLKGVIASFNGDFLLDAEVTR